MNDQEVAFHEPYLSTSLWLDGLCKNILAQQEGDFDKITFASAASSQLSVIRRAMAITQLMEDNKDKPAAIAVPTPEAIPTPETAPAEVPAIDIPPVV